MRAAQSTRTPEAGGQHITASSATYCISYSTDASPPCGERLRSLMFGVLLCGRHPKNCTNTTRETGEQGSKGSKTCVDDLRCSSAATRWRKLSRVQIHGRRHLRRSTRELHLAAKLSREFLEFSVCSPSPSCPFPPDRPTPIHSTACSTLTLSSGTYTIPSLLSHHKQAPDAENNLTLQETHLSHSGDKCQCISPYRIFSRIKEQDETPSPHLF